MDSDNINLERCFLAFGNGDVNKGQMLLQKLADRLEYARTQHGWGKDREISSCHLAHEALHDEIVEWTHTLAYESDNRQLDEALDIIAVAVRIANQEYNI